MNKNRILNALPIMLLVILSFSSTWALDGDSPRIVIKEPVYNAGKIMQGETIAHVYSVQNLGELPLEIKSVKPG
jgi:hypothetical protein